MRRNFLDRRLSVGRGVADIFLVRTNDMREPFGQRLDDFARVVERQGGLGDISEIALVAELEIVDISNGLDQNHGVFGQLPHCADDLRMTFMADEQNTTSATPVDFRFPMHLCDERAGRVDRQKIAIPRFG